MPKTASMARSKEETSKGEQNQNDTKAAIQADSPSAGNRAISRCRRTITAMKAIETVMRKATSWPSKLPPKRAPVSVTTTPASATPLAARTLAVAFSESTSQASPAVTNGTVA